MVLMEASSACQLHATCCRLQEATQALYAKLGKKAEKDAIEVSLVPEILWRYVYGLYGLDADQLGVNFLTFTGTP